MTYFNLIEFVYIFFVKFVFLIHYKYSKAFFSLNDILDEIINS